MAKPRIEKKQEKDLQELIREYWESIEEERDETPSSGKETVRL